MLFLWCSSHRPLVTPYGIRCNIQPFYTPVWKRTVVLCLGFVRPTVFPYLFQHVWDIIFKHGTYLAGGMAIICCAPIGPYWFSFWLVQFFALRWPKHVGWGKNGESMVRLAAPPPPPPPPPHTHTHTHPPPLPHSHTQRKVLLPDNMVHGANMGPIWGRQDPAGPHVGPMNFSICVVGHSLILAKGSMRWSTAALVISSKPRYRWNGTRSLTQYCYEDTDRCI